MIATRIVCATEHPQEFLLQIFEIDQLAAVRIANKWGSVDVGMERYKAACLIADKQQVVPNCQSCGWPVLSDDPHTACDSTLGGEAWMGTWDTDPSDDDTDIDEDDDEDDDSDEEDDVSPQDVYWRAYRHFGNHELAHEAATQYPGDFI